MTPPSRNQAAAIAGVAVATAAATILFLLPWWNRHLGMSLDGYMPLYGHLILGGKIPYRDFFLHLPPLQPLAEAALEAVAGRSLYAVRLAGAIGRIAIAAVAAAWLARRFRPATALLAAFLGVCLLSSDDTEILDLYNQWATLGALASGWFAAQALDGGRRSRWLWFASGVSAAAALWTKQTVGLGATVAVPLALAALALRDREGRALLLRGFTTFAMGWLAVGLLLGGWLASHGAWSLFVDDVFRAAAASKGPPAQLLVRPWLDPFRLDQLRPAAEIGLAVTLAAFAAIRVPVEPRAAARRLWLSILAASGLVLALIALGYELPSYLPTSSSFRSADLLRDTVRVGVVLGLFGVVPIAAALALRTLRRPLAPAERELLVAALVAAAIAATHAFSFPTGGASGMPSTALVLALALDAPSRRRWLAPLRALPVAACLLALLAAIGIRRVEPFDFAQWQELPTARSTQASTLPELAGLRLSGTTRGAAETLVADLQAATRKDDALFTFPVYPIFNWLADRPPATFAILHWIDVTPDSIVERDLAALEAAPPAAVIAQWIPERALSLNEEYFRQGRPSGMRRMRDALWPLLRRDYVRVREVAVPGHRDPPLELWLRRDRAAALAGRAGTPALPVPPDAP